MDRKEGVGLTVAWGTGRCSAVRVWLGACKEGKRCRTMAGRTVRVALERGRFQLELKLSCKWLKATQVEIPRSR